ncbi:hypothetical protein INT45_001373 [Circinella minor]|uniref:Uncharacterized protein n=1 Tax=Circinella minor TaxID=1195481 RepID=A0A8H7RT59_9FUNG|nr:hypothetical protein INT45_001373 [Circinella minor]
MRKQSQPLLTAEKVSKLTEDFKKYRSYIACPTKKCAATNMDTNGYTTHQLPKQPRFKCRTCNKGNVNTRTMQQMIQTLVSARHGQEKTMADIVLQN